ncbi:hypothetical protein ACQKGO_11260 [Corallococcus interemptor]|uniref:hypothetical protein n=1 Tax=Corallococcus interemptor TaxID=2316720 RepID=UPI003D00374C
MGLGLSAPEARALEFVLAWFGHPFDSVTFESASGHELRWGAWPLSGPTLATALCLWKQREPEAFENRLGRLGLDAIPHSDNAPALFPQDPRLLAALARAGRERGAQRAQLEALVTHVLRPMLASCTQTELASGGLFASARALALLFHAELRFGRRGATRLVTFARERPEPPAGERLAEELRASGHPREASELWRILTSPELADPA